MNANKHSPNSKNLANPQYLCVDCKSIDEFLNSDVPDIKCLCTNDIIFHVCKEVDELLDLQGTHDTLLVPDFSVPTGNFVLLGMEIDEQHSPPQDPSSSLVTKSIREYALGIDALTEKGSVTYHLALTLPTLNLQDWLCLTWLVTLGIVITVGACALEILVALLGSGGTSSFSMAKQRATMMPRLFCGITVKRTISWDPPLKNWIKINVDGLVITEPLADSACGGVLSNSRSEFVCAFARNVGSCNIMHIELWGIFFGLEVAWNRAVAKDWEVELQHTYREANSVADKLATLGHGRNFVI
ncbi:ribonuclease H [Senna tora]|uniref:Ribonuclease H n=1 Tax=Senna tora TaxID=362788 RepID=A0A834WNE5_9FABA|nr:ribonuclease H [Senna tora]